MICVEIIAELWEFYVLWLVFFFHILLSLNCFSYIGKKARFINITHINFSCSCWWARLIGCCVYPAAHTPDNSFLGFVVEQHLNASDVKHIDDIKRQNQSLVYGKVDNFWKVSSARNQSLTTFFLGCLHVKPCCVYTLDCFATFSDFESQQKCFQFDCDDFIFPLHKATAGSTV